MKRSGFTMVELLVVMTIIAFLVSISWVVVAGNIESSRIASTRATIITIREAQHALLAVNRESVIKSKAQTLKARYDSEFPANSPTTCPLNVAEVVCRRLALRELLPQRLEDLFGLDGVQGTADDAPLLRKWLKATSGTLRPASHTTESESSELLYLVLTDCPGDIVIRSLAEGVRAKNVADTDRDGLREFIDDWGNPLRFYNCPTRLTRPGGSGTPIDYQLYRSTAELLWTTPIPSTPIPFPANEYWHPVNQDPDDFTGAFSAAQASTGILASPYRLSGTVHPAVDDDSFWSLDTHWETIIVSAGPDERIGLVEPTGWDVLTGTVDNPRRNGEPLGFRDPSLTEDVNDNISSARLR